MKSVISFLFVIMALLQSCSMRNVLEREQGSKEPVSESVSAISQYPVQHPDYPVYKQLCESSLEKAKMLFAQVLANQAPKTIQTVLEPLNEIDMALDAALNKASVYSNAHPDKAVRDLADHCAQEFSKFYTELGLSRPLFDAVKTVDVSQADAETRRVVELLLRDFRRAGVDKDEATRQKIRILNEELTQISQDFENNINNSVRHIALDSVVDMDGLPQDYIDAHQPDANGKIIITTNYPDYQPFMRYAKSDANRKALMYEFLNRAYPENASVLKVMLEKRYELAQTLGYQHYADYITENKMIKTSQNAQDFIEHVSRSTEKASVQEVQVLLQRLKKTDPQAQSVQSWQVSYLSELIRSEKYQMDSKMLRQYFNYKDVRKGIIELASYLFSVQIKPGSMSVWHENVEPYEVWENGKVIGRFYLDMHPREGKFKHVAEFTLINGIKGYRIPEATLLCNFPNGLMEHSQVEVFLHEFGHLIHQLFAVSDHWVALSGIRNETDFVEAPSQMLEEWAWNADTLKTFARNEKGEVMPDALIEKMQKTRYFGQGLGARKQMLYAAISLNFHDRVPDFNMTQMYSKLIENYYPYNYLEGAHEYAGFGHLGGYSAVYYTYMWSKVIALDMFSQFEKQGILNREVAKHYRQTVLLAGPKKDAAALVQDFLGRPYNFKAFERFIKRIKNAH